LHPETRAGVAGGKASGKARGTSADSAPVQKSFVIDTSTKTGFSSRVVHEELQVAKNLTPEAKEAIRQHDIPKTDALKLARMEPEKQRAVVDKIASGEAKTVDAASRAISLANAKESILKQTTSDVKDNPPTVYLMDCLEFINKSNPCDLLLEHKEIYESLHPETKKGAVNQYTKVLSAESANHS
jgi:hypothetical protein